MQIENVMHLLIPCLIEDGKFLWGKNVVKTNNFRKSFSHYFQTNPKGPPCNIRQRVKFLSLTEVSDLNGHRNFNLYPLHHGFMVKAPDGNVIISVFIQIKDTR